MKRLIPIFLVARTASTRLPGKMLAQIQGKTVLEHLLDRLKLAKRTDGLILCTTSLAADDHLVKIATSRGLECYRGDPDDVPMRLLGAAREVGAEFLIFAEGDEVFMDPDYVDQIVECYRETKADYVRITGLPIGSWVSGVKVKALARMCEMKPEGATDTWGRFLTEAGIFKTVTLPPDPPLPAFDPELRMTLDYPEDLELVRAVFDHLYVPGRVLRLKDVVLLLQRLPELVDMNRHLNEVYQQRCEAQHEAQFKRKSDEGTGRIPS